MISILLAFGIDALWAQRQLRVEEREALAALETEFTTNLTAIDRVITMHTGNRGLIETLVSLTREEVRARPQVAISAMMLAVSSVGTFDPILGTTDALIGAGRLGVLRHPPLRESLTTFMNLVADAAEDASIMVRSAEEVWLAEVELGGPWTDPETEIAMNSGVAVVIPNFVPRASADDLLRVREDRHFMGLVARHYIDVGYYVVEVERLREQTRSVLDLIEESSQGRE